MALMKYEKYDSPIGNTTVEEGNFTTNQSKILKNETLAMTVLINGVTIFMDEMVHIAEKTEFGKEILIKYCAVEMGSVKGITECINLLQVNLFPWLLHTCHCCHPNIHTVNSYLIFVYKN